MNFELPATSFAISSISLSWAQSGLAPRSASVAQMLKPVGSNHLAQMISPYVLGHIMISSIEVQFSREMVRPGTSRVMRK